MRDFKKSLKIRRLIRRSKLVVRLGVPKDLHGLDLSYAKQYALTGLRKLVKYRTTARVGWYYSVAKTIINLFKGKKS